MNSSNQWLLPQNIADNYSQQPSRQSSAPSSLRQTLQSLGTGLLYWLVNGSEIRVRRSTLPNGETRWNAYDPQGNRRIRQATDAELRTWIEQRYR